MNATATVTATAGLNLRAAPSRSGELLTTLPTGATITLLSDERRQADGLTWANVEGSGIQGWVATEVNGVLTFELTDEFQPPNEALFSIFATADEVRQLTTLESLRLAHMRRSIELTRQKLAEDEAIAAATEQLAALYSAILARHALEATL